ncbi:MAG: hypothetical protein JSV41_00255 [Gemmatimonadota bacterium]|nr:MAG: hypothetical protein JSV41_00255 [Gemmatimonadota bacterium]
MDSFGHLMEWGRVLEEIDRLRISGELDEHQRGLLRVLRYRGNWRLREAVLRAVTEMDAPGETLLSAVLEIMVDGSLYHEVRVLAAEALASGLARAHEQKRHDLDDLKQRAVEHANELLNSTQAPVVCEGVRLVLSSVE